MKKTKSKKLEKTIWGIKKIWRIREISPDGLIKIPKRRCYDGEEFIFDEHSGYDSVESAEKDIAVYVNTPGYGYANIDNLVIMAFVEKSSVGGIYEDG